MEYDSYLTDDESSNSDFLPLAILRQSLLVPKLLSPPKFYYHPTSHKKETSELAIQNKDKVGGSDVNVLIHSQCLYHTDDHSTNSDIHPLTILKQRNIYLHFYLLPNCQIILLVIIKEIQN